MSWDNWIENNDCANIYQVVKDMVVEFGLKKETRKREVVYRRFYLMIYLWENTNYTQETIGALFGRDHAMVVYAKKKVKSFTAFERKCYNEIVKPVVEYLARYDFDLAEQTEQAQIANEVMQCNNYWELVKLKEKIKAKRQKEYERTLITGKL